MKNIITEYGAFILSGIAVILLFVVLGSFVVPGATGSRLGDTILKHEESINGDGSISDTYSLSYMIPVEGQYDPDEKNNESDFRLYDTVLVKRGSNVTAIAPSLEPKYKGYTFSGWSLDMENVIDTDSLLVTRDMKLFGVFKRNKYSLMLFPNNDEEGNDCIGTTCAYFHKTKKTTEIIVKYESTQNNKLDFLPTKEGYTFMGWYTKPMGNGALVYDANNNAVISNVYWKEKKNKTVWGCDESLSLYACWKANSYELRLYPMADSFMSVEIDDNTYSDIKEYYTKDIIFNDTFKADIPYKKGYTFLGWYSQAEGGIKVFDENGNSVKNTVYFNDDNIYIKPSELRLYARYKANDYKINVYPMGDEFSPAYLYESIYSNTSDYVSFDVTQKSKNNNTLPVPIRDGYTFMGYYDDSDLMIYDSSGKCTNEEQFFKADRFRYGNDLNLYAKYTENTYKITLHLGGDLFSKAKYENSYYENDSDNPTVKCTINDTVNFAVPSRVGFTFLGYYSAKEDGIMIADENGKTTNEGKYFYNINTDEHNAGSYRFADNLQLYARWSENTYTLKLNPNSGSVKNDTYTYTYSISDASEINIATKKGYSFLGWYTALDGGYQIYDETGKYISANKLSNSGNEDASLDSEYFYNNKYRHAASTTLYAHWSAHVFTVTQHSSLGVLNDVSSWRSRHTDYVAGNITYDKTFVLSDIADTMTGHEFLGWYSDPNDGIKVFDTSGQPVRNTIYFDANGNYIYDDNLDVYECFKPIKYKVEIYGLNSDTLQYTNIKTFTMIYGSSTGIVKESEEDVGIYEYLAREKAEISKGYYKVDGYYSDVATPYKAITLVGDYLYYNRYYDWNDNWNDWKSRENLYNKYINDKLDGTEITSINGCGKFIDNTATDGMFYIGDTPVIKRYNNKFVWVGTKDYVLGEAAGSPKSVSVYYYAENIAQETNTTRVNYLNSVIKDYSYYNYSSSDSSTYAFKMFCKSNSKIFRGYNSSSLPEYISNPTRFSYWGNSTTTGKEYYNSHYLKSVSISNLTEKTNDYNSYSNYKTLLSLNKHSDSDYDYNFSSNYGYYEISSDSRDTGSTGIYETTLFYTMLGGISAEYNYIYSGNSYKASAYNTYSSSYGLYTVYPFYAIHKTIGPDEWIVYKKNISSYFDNNYIVMCSGQKNINNANFYNYYSFKEWVRYVYGDYYAEEVNSADYKLISGKIKDTRLDNSTLEYSTSFYLYRYSYMGTTSGWRIYTQTYNLRNGG